MNEKPPKYVTGRSMPLAIVLAFLFGPFGLFYASVLGGLLLLVVAPAVLAARLGVAPAVGATWALSVVWAIVAVLRRNAAAHAYIAKVNAAS